MVNIIKHIILGVLLIAVLAASLYSLTSATAEIYQGDKPLMHVRE